jgi:DNA-binding transcriptional LysR family regulator
MHSALSVNLDDFKYFLAVARRGRLVLAAERLQVEHTTVSRRIQSLEKGLGVRLFERTPGGWVLSEAGARLFPTAVEIEELTQRAQADASGSDDNVRGGVRILANDGVGAFLAPPMLERLQRRLPHVSFEVLTTSQVLSYRTGEFDIALTIHRPDSDLVTSEKVTDYSLRLNASADYLARHPPVTETDQLADHSMIWYVESLIGLPELRFFTEIVGQPQFGFRSNSIFAQHRAVAAGAGIGLLPCYLADSDPSLVPVLHSQMTVQRTYWLAVPNAVGRVRRVALTAQHLLRELQGIPDRLEPPPAESHAPQSRRQQGAPASVPVRCAQVVALPAWPGP